MRILVFLFILAAVATPERVMAQTNSKTTCGEDIVATVDVPDGDVSFEVVEGKPLINMRVRHAIGRGYYALATAQLALKPDTKITATDRGVQLQNGEYRMVLLRGIGGMHSLLPFLSLDKALAMESIDGDIGFHVAINWSSEIKEPDPPTERVARLSDQLSSSEYSPQSFLQRNRGVSSRRPGFQWWVSSNLIAKIDSVATLARVRPCITELYIVRTANPRPTSSAPRASR